MNLYKRISGEQAGYNVQLIASGSALAVHEIRRNENLDYADRHGYTTVLSDGTEWQGWFFPESLKSVWAQGDEVVWMRPVPPYWSPQQGMGLVNLSKPNPAIPTSIVSSLCLF